MQVVEPQGTFVAWNEPAFDTQTVVNRGFAENDVQQWTFLLSQSLLKLEPDAELVRDLEDVVRNTMSRWGSFAAA